MGLRFRFIMLTLGSVMPSCLLLIPASAVAETSTSPQDETRHTIALAIDSIDSDIGLAGVTPLASKPFQQRLPEQAETLVEAEDLNFESVLSQAPETSSETLSPEAQLPQAQQPSSGPTVESIEDSETLSEPALESTDTPDTAESAPASERLESDSAESAVEVESPAGTDDSSEIDEIDEMDGEADPDASADMESDAEEATAEEDEEIEEAEAEAAEEDEAVAEAHARWQQLLIEGDRLFLRGQYLEAEELYQQAKDPEDVDPDPVERPEAFADPEQLSPAGQVYWREYQAGRETGLETRMMVPLQLLTTEYPEFVPAQVEYALLLGESDDEEAQLQAKQQLEQATALFPNNAELARARVDFLAENEDWLQAAIAARQFAVLNPDAPNRADFEADAEEYQERFRSRLRGRLRRNAIGNVITGALGFVLTGNLFGPISALDTTVLMLRGESAVGESIANRAVEDLDLITDDEVVGYVNDIGRELAALAGRDEFEYEFYVVEEDDLNAFALPGGKVFVNAGAILKAETEAEFAGLLAHELAHAVLSHGFQIVTGGNLTANVLQYVPYGGYVANLAVLRYSRDMERQADALGTQLLASSEYAADGLHRLMITLHEESDRRSRFDWLSTHPDTPERIRRIDQLIERNGYNRYAFEGIERHLQIQARVEELLREADKLEGEDEIDLGGEPESSEDPPEASEDMSEPPPEPALESPSDISNDVSEDEVDPNLY